MPMPIQIRRDTSSNWSTANPTLALGEIGFETNTYQVKIGDGTTAWNSLGYIGKLMPNGTVVGTSDTQTLSNKTLTSSIFSGGTLVNPSGVATSNLTSFITGTAASFSIPTELRVPGAKWKVTLVGGGGQGGGTPATAAHYGSGGNSGAVVIGFYAYVAGQDSMTYTVGAGGAGAGTNTIGNNGANTTTTYNSVTFTAGGGTGGDISANNTPGTSAAASGGSLNLGGYPGHSGGVAAANNPAFGAGADTPLGFGRGGDKSFATGAGLAGTGFGSGGSGGQNVGTATARAGGAGAGGILIIEY
jgi:hypothetical protein